LALTFTIVDQKNILSKFLYYQLKNFYQEKEISSYVKGVGNPTIDKISIRSIHINLCSVEEQIRIVQEIEARLSLCDNIDICIKQGLNKANALRQSILKQAFEGKLLSEAELEKCKNESDWEPAEILLEKINNELRSAK
jgi:type I restriction enzyme S subunit